MADIAEGFHDLNETDLLLALLYAPISGGKPNAPIEGATRLQKLIFLLQHGSVVQSARPRNLEFEFEPWKMGPFSADLRNVLQEFTAAGLIATERLAYHLRDDTDPHQKRRVESLRFRLTKLGEKVAAEVWSQFDAKQQKDLEKFKTFYASLSLRQLLIYVYEHFPEFTSQSLIREQLGLEE